MILATFYLDSLRSRPLRNEMIQRYAIAQRPQVDFDQLSVANHSSSRENMSRFKRVFNSNREEGKTLDYAFETVRREILPVNKTILIFVGYFKNLQLLQIIQSLYFINKSFP